MKCVQVSAELSFVATVKTQEVWFFFPRQRWKWKPSECVINSA